MSYRTLENQGRRVKMRIVEYVTRRAHAGRRGHHRIPAGTKLYLLAYEHDEGGYFTYGYIDKADAETCVENSRLYDTDTEFFMEWNRVLNPEDVMHVFPKT